MSVSGLQSNWQLWRWPVGLALLSLTGLITALVSDDLGDWMAWLALGLLPLVAWHFGLRRRDSQVVPNAGLTAPGKQI